MLSKLVKLKIKGMLDQIFNTSKKKGHGSGTKILMIGIILYFFIVFGGLFTVLFFSISTAFIQIGLGWLYFGLMALFIFFFGFISSVFITQSQIYSAKDNELLLSMPIKTSDILLSRLLSLLMFNYGIELIVIIPGAIAYIVNGQVTVGGSIFFILGFLLLPLLILTLSAIFGWLIAYVNSKLGNNNIFMMLLTLILFGVYMYLCFTMQSNLEKILANGEDIANAIQKIIPPFYYLGDAIFNVSLLSFLIYTAWMVIPFAIIYKILSVTFIKIATTPIGYRRVKYKSKQMTVMGVRKALILKEIRHFIGEPMYMFNSGMGLILMVGGAAYLLLNKESAAQFINGMLGSTGDLGAFICLIIGMLGASVIISAPTISIEARTMWITQSSPVPERDALLAKADMHILITLPFVYASVAIVLGTLNLDFTSTALVAVFPAINTTFNALLGVALNIKFPRFDWVSETSAVKHGAAPMLSWLLSMAIIALPLAVYALALNAFMSMTIMFIAITVFLAVGSVGLYAYITTKGAKEYRYIQE